MLGHKPLSDGPVNESLLQWNIYGDVPPATVAVIPPLQPDVALVVDKLMAIIADCEMLTEVFTEQPLESITDTV